MLSEDGGRTRLIDLFSVPHPLCTSFIQTHSFHLRQDLLYQLLNLCMCACKSIHRERERSTGKQCFCVELLLCHHSHHCKNIASGQCQKFKSFINKYPTSVQSSYSSGTYLFFCHSKQLNMSRSTFCLPCAPLKCNTPPVF